MKAELRGQITLIVFNTVFWEKNKINKNSKLVTEGKNWLVKQKANHSDPISMCLYCIFLKEINSKLTK